MIPRSRPIPQQPAPPLPGNGRMAASSPFFEQLQGLMAGEIAPEEAKENKSMALDPYADIEDIYYPVSASPAFEVQGGDQASIGVVLRKLTDIDKSNHKELIRKYPNLNERDFIELSLGSLAGGPWGNEMYYDIPQYKDSSLAAIHERERHIRNTILNSLSVNDVALGSVLISQPYAEDGKQLARARLFTRQYGFGPLNLIGTKPYQYMQYAPTEQKIGIPISLYDEAKAKKAISVAHLHRVKP